MECFVGVDVAKAGLDLAVEPTGERWTVSHDDAGVNELLRRLGREVPIAAVRDDRTRTRPPEPHLVLRSLGSARLSSSTYRCDLFDKDLGA
jgi:hypothetical protein